MSNSKPWLWACATVMAAISAAAAQTSSQAPEEARQAAAKSIQTLEGYEAARITGPSVPAPGAGMSLGEPFHDYIIRLDDLKNWDGKDASALLHSTGRYVYPINMRGIAQASVTVGMSHGQWTCLRFGTRQEAESRSFIEENLRRDAPGSHAGTGIEVRLPTFHVSFIAQRTGGELQFTPTKSLPKYDLEAGKTEPARKVLLRLQPAAQKLDPDQPN